jgi:hypothetical protein
MWDWAVCLCAYVWHFWVWGQITVVAAGACDKLIAMVQMTLKACIGIPVTEGIAGVVRGHLVLTGRKDAKAVHHFSAGTCRTPARHNIRSCTGGGCVHSRQEYGLARPARARARQRRPRMTSSFCWCAGVANQRMSGRLPLIMCAVPDVV